MSEQLLQEEFGRVVRDWRSAQGFSQEGFAYRSGIHRTYMTHIERGTKVPSLAIVARIARALDVELSELFAEVERRGATIRLTTADPEKFQGA